MQHGDPVSDGPDAGHVMGDRHGRRAHLGHNLADQIIDNAGHDRVEPRGGFIKENDLGICRNCPCKTHALLHSAGKLCGKQIGHVGAHPDALQFLYGDRTGFFLGAFQRASQQTKRHVLPDRQTVKQRSPLKEHPELRKKRITISGGGIFARNRDCAFVWCHQSKNALQ